MVVNFAWAPSSALGVKPQPVVMMTIAINSFSSILFEIQMKEEASAVKKTSILCCKHQPDAVSLSASTVNLFILKSLGRFITLRAGDWNTILNEAKCNFLRMRLQKKTFWFILKTLCERLLRANDEIVNFRPSDCLQARKVYLWETLVWLFMSQKCFFLNGTDFLSPHIFILFSLQ